MNTGNRNFHPIGVEKRVFEGWQAIWLKNEFIEAVVAPDIGGRIMAFNL